MKASSFPSLDCPSARTVSVASRRDVNPLPIPTLVSLTHPFRFDAPPPLRRGRGRGRLHLDLGRFNLDHLEAQLPRPTMQLLLQANASITTKAPACSASNLAKASGLESTVRNWAVRSVRE